MGTQVLLLLLPKKIKKKKKENFKSTNFAITIK